MIHHHYGMTSKFISLVLMLMVSLAADGALGAVQVDTDSSTGARGSGEQLTINDDYTVSGNESWASVTVMDTGTLAIPSGATLNAISIKFISGSALNMTGGKLVLTSPTSSGNACICGTCSKFDLTSGSKILVNGAAGNYSMATSMGGMAVFDIRVTNSARIEGSNITICGGSGYDLSSGGATGRTWTDSDLGGSVAAGGAGQFTLCISVESTLKIKGSGIQVAAGNGGDASDGQVAQSGCGVGQSGGYSAGGKVSGFIGAGGNATLRIESLGPVEIQNSTIEGVAGKGGDAGDGGDGYGYAGGAGGYGGGKSQNFGAGFDANVSGFVGSGGNIELGFQCTALSVSNSSLRSAGGNGGNAGNGGDAVGTGAGGGGGYGGGGGGRTYAGNASVIGSVGTGGYSDMVIKSANTTFYNSFINSSGGDGGKPGNGGTGSDSEGGGGGGFGGGGGGSYTGGWAYVEGFVGSGGNASILLNCSLLNLSDTKIISDGGEGQNGGKGGTGGIDYGGYEHYEGGGGGGGYGGGGGKGTDWYGGGCTTVAGNIGVGGLSYLDLGATRLDVFASVLNSSGGMGGDGGLGNNTKTGGGGGYGGCGGSYSTCNLTGKVGDGGNTSLLIRTARCFISNDTTINASGGPGGNGTTSKGGGIDGIGGEGLGRNTTNGSVIREIPMSIPYLLSPPNASLFDGPQPKFEWREVYGESTTNGNLSSYILQLDNAGDFQSPQLNLSVGKTGCYAPLFKLNRTSYHWRVKAVYSTPSGAAAGWSDVWVVVLVDTQPAQIKAFDNVLMDEDTILRTGIDPDQYFKDADGDGLEFEWNCSGGHVAAIIDVNGVTLVPQENWHGLEKMTFIAHDIKHNASGTMNITVRSINDRPILNDTTGWVPPAASAGKLVAKQGVWLNVTVTAHDHADPEDVLAFGTDLPAVVPGLAADPNCRFSGETGAFSILPTNDMVGVYQVNFSVDDGGIANSSASRKISLEILNANDPPGIPEILTPANNSVVDMDQPVNFSAICDDPDLRIPSAGEVLSFCWSSSLDGSIGEGQTLRGVKLEYGVHMITVSARDRSGASSSARITLTVRPPPSMPIPFVNLTAPVDGSQLHNSTIRLSWTTDFEDESSLVYDVFLDANITPTTVVSRQHGTNYSATGLKEGLTYHWYVRPSVRNLEGVCFNGVWSFTVNPPLVEQHTVMLASNYTSFDLYQGQNGFMLVALTNLGNVAENVSITLAAGILAGQASISPDIVFVPAGSIVLIRLSVNISNQTPAGIYILNMTARAGGGAGHSLLFHATIHEREQPPPPVPPAPDTIRGSWTGSWLLVALGLALVLAAASIAYFVSKRKKRSKTIDAATVLRPSVVQQPSPAGTPSPPQPNLTAAVFAGPCPVCGQPMAEAPAFPGKYCSSARDITKRMPFCSAGPARSCQEHLHLVDILYGLEPAYDLAHRVSFSLEHQYLAAAVALEVEVAVGVGPHHLGEAVPQARHLGLGGMVVDDDYDAFHLAGQGLQLLVVLQKQPDPVPDELGAGRVAYVVRQ